MRLHWLAAGLLLSCCPMTAQRLIVSVANGVMGLPDGSFASGSLIRVTIGYSVQVQTAPKSVLTLHSVDSNSSVELPQYPQQPLGFPVWTVIPENTPTESAELKVSAEGWESAVLPLFISCSNFGIFPDAAQQYEAAGPVPNKFTASARPGMMMTLWGTGLGNIDSGQVVVRISDIAVRPGFAGPAPGQPGSDQINFQVPDDDAIPDDCYVPASEPERQVANSPRSEDQGTHWRCSAAESTALNPPSR